MIEDAKHEVGKYTCSRYACGLVSEVDTEIGGMCRAHASPLLIEIQRPYELRNIVDKVPLFVPWEFLKPHERTAERNHGGQTIARLSERGGMSLKETLAVVTDCDWDDIARLSRDEAADKLLELLAAWEEGAV